MRRGRPRPIPADPAPVEVILLAFRSLLGPLLCHGFGRLLLCFFPLVFALAHEILLRGYPGAACRIKFAAW